MRNKSGLVFMAAGALLVALAIGLTAYNIQDGNRAAADVARAAKELRVRTDEIARIELPDFVIPAYEIDPRVEMPVVEIEGRGYVGYISIPSQDLELPVINECTDKNMRIAPCRYYGSAYMNNLVIAAHNYTNHFGRLGSVMVGDPVEFTDVDGNRFRYTVTDLEQLLPGQTVDMVGYSEDWDLTLFTCTISGRQRLTVRCSLIEEEPPA